MAQVARRLAAMGHRLVTVTQNPDLMRRAFTGLDATMEPAPTSPVPEIPAGFADSYAELLLRCGFADPADIGTRLTEWAALFARHRPDLVITDFAPTAMLAARRAGLTVAAVENGYSLPPRQDPLPFTRAWEVPPPDRLRTLDDTARRAINQALAAQGDAPLDSLAALFDVAAPILCTVPELDHYQDRGPADFFGPIYAQDTGVAPGWPQAPGPRVFAYLDTAHPTYAPTLHALAQKGWPTVLHARGAGGAPASSTLRCHAEPVQMDLALAQCDIVVCQGLATVSAALLAGRPIVQMPGHLEQTMVLHRVVVQGLGVGVLREAGHEHVAAALDLVRSDPGYASRARAFADRYHGFSSADASQAVAADCAALL